MIRVSSRLAWGLALAGLAGCWEDPVAGGEPIRVERNADHTSRWGALQEKHEEAVAEYREALASNPGHRSPDVPYRKHMIDHMQACVRLYEEIVEEGNRILAEYRAIIREKYEKDGLPAEEAERKAQEETADFQEELSRWEREIEDPRGVLEHLERELEEE